MTEPAPQTDRLGPQTDRLTARTGPIAAETGAGRVRRVMRAARYRLVDVAAILASWFFALVLVGEALETGRIREDESGWMLLVGVLASATIWWRRSHPMAMTVIQVPLGLLAEATVYSGLVVLYTLITLRRGRVIGVVLVLSWACGVAYAWMHPDPMVPLVAEAVLAAAILAATAAIAMAVRARRELVGSLRERAVRAEEESRLRADRLRALERERIAREMHDALAHRISMVSLHAGALQIRPDLSPEEVARAAATIRDSAHHALEDLREILGVLRAGEVESSLRPQPDLSRLGELIAGAGVPVDCDNRLDGVPAAPSLGRTVYRLVQEGLTNAGKHAPGVRVHLLLERTAEGELHVRLANALPVRPAPAVPGAEAGLVGLAERVELVGGRLRHGVRRDPAAGIAFHLEAWLPWPT